MLFFYENDVWYNLADRYFGALKPSFRLVEGALSLDRPEARDTTSTPSAPEVADGTSLVRRFDGWWDEHSKLYFLLRIRIKQSAPIYNAIVKIFGVTPAWVPMPAEFEVWAKEPAERIEGGWDLTESLLVNLRDSVEADGGVFSIFYVPSPAVFDPKRWKATVDRYGLNEEHWNPEEPGRRLAAICRANGLHCQDPTPYLLTLDTLPGLRVYLSNDRHWGAHGNDVIGRLVADYLLTDHP